MAHTLEESPKNISCNICGEHFRIIRELMSHKKNEHADRVALCWKCKEDKCNFGDSGCWFRHSESECSESTKMKCNLCDIEFRCLTDLLKHRKKEHEHIVQKCKNQGFCHFGSRNCWLLHTNAYKKVK